MITLMSVLAQAIALLLAPLILAQAYVLTATLLNWRIDITLLRALLFTALLGSTTYAVAGAINMVLGPICAIVSIAIVLILFSRDHYPTGSHS